MERRLLFCCGPGCGKGMKSPHCREGDMLFCSEECRSEWILNVETARPAAPKLNGHALPAIPTRTSFFGIWGRSPRMR